jgi:hypothetical protein
MHVTFYLQFVTVSSMLRCSFNAACHSILIAGMLSTFWTMSWTHACHFLLVISYCIINVVLQFQRCMGLDFDSRYAINFLDYVLDTCMSLSTCNLVVTVSSMLRCSFNAACAWILIAGMLSTFWTMSWTHACLFLLVICYCIINAVFHFQCCM